MQLKGTMWRFVVEEKPMIISECDTPPPCVLRTALFWPCVLRTAIFGLVYFVPFNNKTIIFGVSVYIKQIKWQYYACTWTIISANFSLYVFVCLLDFLVFDLLRLLKSMFKFRNAEMTQNARVKLAREKIRVVWLYMSRSLCFLIKIGPFLK